jgi:hypothetical protein
VLFSEKVMDVEAVSSLVQLVKNNAVAIANDAKKLFLVKRLSTCFINCFL